MALIAATPAWGQDQPPTPTALQAQPKVQVHAVWHSDQARPSAQNVLAVVFDIVPNWHIASDRSQAVVSDFKPSFTRVQVKTPDPRLAYGPAQFPKAHRMSVESMPDPIAVFSEQAVVYLPVLISPDAEPGEIEVHVDVRYQACDDKRCDFPKTVTLAKTLTLVAADASGLTEPGPVDLFDGFDPGMFATMGSTASTGATMHGETIDFFGFGVDPSRAWGFVLLLLLAALGGALLNFTPCVLPVIPIKILGLAQTAGNRGRTLALGAVMAGGVVAFWLGLGVAIAGVSGFTASNQLFQYPVFSIGVGAVIAVLAVGMCGLFNFSLPNWVYAISPRHDSYAGSFGFGVMTAVLSTPCTAPLMGAAAAWAATQSPGFTLVTFAAIGVGMALPYLVLSANPKWVDHLPRSGPGSELLKQVMGLLMLAAAAFFIGAGGSGMLSDGTQAAPKGHWWVVAAFVAAAGFWLMLRVFKATPSRIKQLVFVSLAWVAVIGAALTASVLTTPDTWAYYTPQRFEKAQAEGNVVLLDFTADWCANCLLLEQTVLSDERVESLLQTKGYVAMKVDLTGGYPDGKLLLKQTGAVTIPWLVIFAPDGEEVFKDNWYTASQITDALNQARQQLPPSNSPPNP